MAAKIVYNDELLDRISQRDNCTLIQRHDKYTNQTNIEFICHCGTQSSKKFVRFNISGGYCKQCTINNMREHLREFNVGKNNCSYNYNEDLLKEMCIRDNFTVDFSKIKVYNRNIDINFICKCGTEYQKTFKEIVKYGGGFCRECTLQNADRKSKETCLDKYGHEYSLQSQEVRDKGKQTLFNTLGVDHQLKSVEIQNKKKETCLSRMGVEHQFLLPEIQAKCSKTIIERYNVSTCMMIPEIKEKHKQTCLKNWGVEHPVQNQIVKDKFRETCLQKYNAVAPLLVPEIQAKAKQTSLQKYNVPHPSQHPIISQKQLQSAYAKKPYKFPDGQIIQVQGYEPYLLDILVSEGYT
jgi:hypothetical protein